MQLTVAYDFLPKTPTANAAVVMDHFGVGFETGRHVIADRLELPIQPGDIVCFTGASGSGKSSLMRAAAAALVKRLSANGEREGEGAMGSEGAGEEVPRFSVSLPSIAPSPPLPSPVLSLDRIDLGDQILVDGLRLPAQEALSLLAACGLGEAQLLLRTPHELSDGQRYRYRLAKAIAMKPRWIVADEFTAALDRTLAKVIAFNLRKLATRTGIGCLVATTHEDIVADLQPDVHVVCRLDGAIRVSRDNRSPLVSRDVESAERSARVGGRAPLRKTSASRLTVKKKTSALRTNCGCPAVPVPTGRTSLGGITAATIWDSCDTSPCCGIGTSRSASASSPRRRSRSARGRGFSDSPDGGRE